MHDSDILVQRSTLDFIIEILPLKSPSISQAHLIQVIMAALQCLLKRDQSIIRRVLMWLLGKVTKRSDSLTDTDDIVDVTQTSDFLTYVKPHLLVALKQLIAKASNDFSSSDKSLLIRPYRLLKIMYEQSEMLSIIPLVLPDVLSCLKSQISQLGGLPISALEPVAKKNGKRYQVGGELLYSANQFWMALDNDLLWGWMEDYLTEHLKKSVENDLQERVDLVLFLFKTLPLVSESLCTHYCQQWYVL